MRAENAAVQRLTHGRVWFFAVVWFVVIGGVAGAADRNHKPRVVSREYAEARELFVKIWTNAKSSHGGDGLGPLFNELSCVGCHHLGGTGGAGGKDRNVKVLSAFVGPANPTNSVGLFQGELEELHPGLRNRTSVVLHRHATSPKDQERLSKIEHCRTLQTRDDLIALGISERSTPALFGSGLIDDIPDAALLAAEKRDFPAFPEIRGRVSRLRNGGVGRFGWKAQTSKLRDFVLAACANELGLEVPGHHQPSLAPTTAFDPSKVKLDMDAGECNLLVRFVANLPRPVFTPVSDTAIGGRAVFSTIGCATCHAPSMGQVDGLYSDLLLHDLGDRIRDFGGGYESSGGGGRVVERPAIVAGAAPGGEAGPNEWRTPPLWGVAHSAPYLHDGRAETLELAIRLHGGEAAATSRRYHQLDRADQQRLLAFLRSLTAPKSAGGTDASRKRSHITH
jgi:CxxC motif-containing protein (DUF1111 family)